MLFRRLCSRFALCSRFLQSTLKQVTTLPWHITPKGTLYGPIYGIYMGWGISYSISLLGT